MNENSETEKNDDNETTYLKDQVNSMQQIINTLQEKIDMKDKALTNVTKERDRILSDLKKHKRSNLNLRQQLEDERAFYMKEKEHYCREMTETKKIRKKQSAELKQVEEAKQQIEEIDTLKADLATIKKVLGETLEANYNLSIKFLRMKNTKYSLKARLRKEQTEHAKIISDITLNLEHEKEQIDHITSEKFRQAIPPSNKKYLQVIQRNNTLMHGNISFQLQISKLYNEIERMKAERIKQETSLRLQYARKLNLQIKNSCDKMCEAKLCKDQECVLYKSNCTLNKEKQSESNFSINKEKQSESNFSSLSYDRQSELYPINYGLYPDKTQSAPEVATRNSLLSRDESETSMQQ